MQRDLVERAMAGDHDAFSELARVSIGRLYAVARLILRDPHRAEDATQEALVVAWRDGCTGCSCERAIAKHVVHAGGRSWTSTWSRSNPSSPMTA